MVIRLATRLTALERAAGPYRTEEERRVEKWLHTLPLADLGMLEAFTLVRDHGGTPEAALEQARAVLAQPLLTVGELAERVARAAVVLEGYPQ